MVLLTPGVVVAGADRAGRAAPTRRGSCGRSPASPLGALCYCAVAAWLSMVTRRPVVLGALYILLWEGSIATFAASADRLSIAAYGRALAVEGVVKVNAPDVSGVAAVLVLAAATALALWGATRRLTRTELP